MASPHETVSMAVFCDFENVALGVRDAKYDKFDIKRVLERLLLKGSIVVKKAYCDWERYKGFKAVMHEASFELIEIPHVRQSGKNSADIRLVVDALDLCYTKSHVNTFVIISGDSDFSPLVSKLRENAKQVIGVGVKQSTSDLLIGNCDEFIFYDDLVRESQRVAARREPREAQSGARRSPDDDKRRKDDGESRKTEAVDMAVETFEALVAERGDTGKIWASMLKEAIKRRKPGFNEAYYGFRTFGNLLEEAQARGLLEVGRDDKSGTFVSRSTAVPSVMEMPQPMDTQAADIFAEAPAVAEAPPEKREPRRGRGRNARRQPEKETPDVVTPDTAMSTPFDADSEPTAPFEPPHAEHAPVTTPDGPVHAPAQEEAPAPAAEEAPRTPRRRTRNPRKPAEAAAPVPQPESAPPAPADFPASEAATETSEPAKPARKSPTRSRRPRKTEPSPDNA